VTNAFFSKRAVYCVALLLAVAAPVRSQDPLRPVAPPSVTSAAADETASLKYNDAPLDMVLADYSEKTGKTLLRAPGLPTPTFTLRSQGPLSTEDYLKAIETVLTMHGVGLVEFGANFIRVVPIKSVRREALEIMETIPQGLVAERSGAMISQMIPLKHIDLAEAVKAIDPLRNENGQINQFERTNALMVTDLAENINRMLQVLRLIDQPIEAKEEPNIIQIRFAKASEIKSRLEEIIAESQKEQQQRSTVPRLRDTGAPGVVQATPPGIIRPRRAPAPETTARVEAELVEAAERGIIRGKVQIVADERTNQLIIITRPSNMEFFKRIIAVLDVETSPDVMVKVRRLDFATAEEVAKMLNDLIGATKKDEGRTPAANTGTDGTIESKRLAEIEAALRSRQTADQPDRKSSVGELSKDNIKILSDKRTNSLILMASKSDMVTLEEIIQDMDMMLSQVLIEAVIIEVKLDDSLETGVSWIQKSMTSYNRNSAGVRSPIFSFAGGGGGGGGVPRDAEGAVDPASLATGGLGYYFTMFDLNMNMLLKASAGDSRSRVVSTPALLTTDNTEAKLTSTERIYVFEGTTYSGTTTDNRTARYRQEDVGLTLTVKPQINENHVVMMAIKQEISEPGNITGSDTENLTGQTISINRVIEASVAVKSGQTIVLGGAVRESDSRSRSKIPLLGDIPILGRLFNSDRRGTGRTETIVFITPYVLDTPDQVDRETKRRRDSLNIEGMWKKGWSGSDLAEPPVPRKQTFPRPPAAVQKPEEVVPAPRPVSRIEPWVSSDGKVARGGARENTGTGASQTLEAPVVPASPVADEQPVVEEKPVTAEQPVAPEKAVTDEKPVAAAKAGDDINEFVNEQMRIWNQALQDGR
jgi:general secretion pathway protein D